MNSKLTIKSKKALVRNVLSKLKKVFPKPECALFHKTHWELLVATILSAQCTDKRVNIVTPELFKKFDNVRKMATAKQKELEKLIKSTGFYHNKAKNIIACAKSLVENYNGIVPDSLKELIKLPGVGRKTASVVLGTCFGIAEGIVVDTHVKRLSFRIGFTSEVSPEKVESDLMRIVPGKDWINISHLLILHGRNRCKARKPDCENCEIKSICLKIM